MDFLESCWNISVSSLVILAASVCKISCGQTNAGENPTPMTAIGVDKYSLSMFMVDCLLIFL